MKTPIKVICLLLMAVIPLSGKGQQTGPVFREVELRIENDLVRMSESLVLHQDEYQIAFEFEDPDAVCEVNLFLAEGIHPDSILLLPSGDFSLVDSLTGISNDQLRFKVQFNDLINVNFLKFSFLQNGSDSSNQTLHEIPLLPYTPTYVKIYPTSDELYIGEEKVFELLTNHIENIRIDPDWVEGSNMNYRISKTFNQVRLHLVPRSLGKHAVNVPLRLKRPVVDSNRQVVYDLPPIAYNFSVRQSRLQFLNMDRNVITLDDSTQREGIEIQLENSRMLQLQKTYRIEKQEEPGGSLVAEIFTKSSLTNNRVLCLLRPYTLHRESEGYLYIKDGDKAQFITNVNITPKTSIERVSILREGNWTENLTVYPGEIINVRIEGVELIKARLAFDELEDVSKVDSVIRGENLALYKFKVPLDVSKRTLELFNNAKPTGWRLRVKEFQEARPFDFVWINYNGVRRSVADLPSTVLVEGTIQNLLFGCDPDMIDSPDKMYGKQYLNLSVTITGRRKELIEVKNIDDLVYCPGLRSPRSEFYADKDCSPSRFDLNRYFRQKTSNLEIWSTIKIRLTHDKTKHGGEGFTKEFDLVLKKNLSFDVEVSFPAGLITLYKPDEGEGKLDPLTGVSIAMIAQFSFYHPEKVNVQRPYKIGAGFLALNTFNFREDATRDLALVILGSVYPTTRDVKLTFPLYIGGGYKLQQRKWMFLIGPGIRVRF